MLTASDMNDVRTMINRAIEKHIQDQAHRSFEDTQQRIADGVSEVHNELLTLLEYLNLKLVVVEAKWTPKQLKIVRRNLLE